MKKIIRIFLCISFCYSGALFCQPASTPKSAPVTARAASESSSNAVMLSMGLWGVGLATAIVLLALLLKGHTAQAH